MDISIHTTFLPHDDPDAALAFYRDNLGFELRNDVGYNGMHWLTVGPPGQPEHVHRAAPARRRPRRHRRRAPHHHRDDGQGHLRQHHAGHPGPRRTFEELQASDVDIVQEPIEQDWGMRDCAVRDPSGNMVRIQEVR